MVKRLFVNILLIIVISGCGYHFKGRAIRIYGIDSFNHVNVKNDTFEPAIEMIFKEDIMALFIKNGWYEKGGIISPDDVVFLCNVTSFKKKPASFRSDDGISQYEAVAHINVRIYYAREIEKPKFSLTDMRYSELYLVDEDVNITSINKQEAITKISTKFTRDLEEMISQGF